MPSWIVEFGRLLTAPLIFSLCALFSAVGLIPCYFAYEAVHAAYGALPALLSVPFLYFVWGITYCACCVVFKLLLWYHPKPGQSALFSWPTVGWGLTGAVTNFANIMFLIHFKGTPLLNLWYRCLGAKVGARVSINTTRIFDWNLVTLGDDVVLGGDCVIMGHSVEGGVMKMRTIDIQKGATIGGESKVMPGCVIGERSVLGASSLLTKETIIPSNQMWGGVPAHFLRERAPKLEASKTPTET